MTRKLFSPQQQRAIVQRIVESYLDYLRRSIEAHPPHSYQELDEQRRQVDMQLCMVLKSVCDVLPKNVEAPVRELLRLRDTIWHRQPVPAQEQKEVQ